MNPDTIRVEWHVNPHLPTWLRDQLLSKLIALERDGHVWLWMEHWYTPSGQFRYKYVITPVPLDDQSAHSTNPRSQHEQTVY